MFDKLPRNGKLRFGLVAPFLTLFALLLLWGYAVFVHEAEIPAEVSELINSDIRPRYSVTLMDPPDERRISHLLIDRYISYESIHRRVADVGTIPQAGSSTQALCVIVRVTYIHYWPPPSGKKTTSFPGQDFEYVAWEKDGLWTLRFVRKSDIGLFGKLSCVS